MYNKSKEGQRSPVTLEDFTDAMLPEKVMDWAGMTSHDGNYKEGQRPIVVPLTNGQTNVMHAEYNLANLNDVSKKGFKYIADVIERHVKDL